MLNINIKNFIAGYSIPKSFILRNHHNRVISSSISSISFPFSSTSSLYYSSSKKDLFPTYNMRKFLTSSTKVDPPTGSTTNSSTAVIAAPSTAVIAAPSTDVIAAPSTAVVVVKSVEETKPKVEIKANTILPKPKINLEDFEKLSDHDKVKNFDISFALPEELKGLINWPIEESIPYSFLVETFEKISATSSRLEKEKIIKEFLLVILFLKPEELENALYLLMNEIYPSYEGKELGIGDSLLVKSICEGLGRTKSIIDEEYAKEGDLGIVAFNSRNNQKVLSFGGIAKEASEKKKKTLKINDILNNFRSIANTSGKSSTSLKVNLIKQLLVKCSNGLEAKYIIRGLQGKLRIGVAEQSVLIGLSTSILEYNLYKKMYVFKKFNVDLEKYYDVSEESHNVRKENKILSEEEVNSYTSFEELLNNIDDIITNEAYLLKNYEYKFFKKVLPLLASPEDISLKLIDLHAHEDIKDQSEIVIKRAFSECPNLNLICTNIINNNDLFDLYKVCKLKIGVPVSPMLAKPTKSILEVLKRINNKKFTMEYKYDGERAQVHLLESGEIKIFSRNSEDNTEKYSDLKQVILNARKEGVTSCIIDAEVVAYDREAKELLPFQVLSTRKRKLEQTATTNVFGNSTSTENNANNVVEPKVKIILQAFDILSLNNKSLLHEPLYIRRKLLHTSFNSLESYFHFAAYSDYDPTENGEKIDQTVELEDDEEGNLGDTSSIETFLAESCANNCEGLMIKTLTCMNSTYEPSKRTFYWLKLKKDYLSNQFAVCDSLDLVPIGGYLGKGKRTGYFGAYLMACYNKELDQFQSVCKIGTGFKDSDLINLMKKFIRSPKRYSEIFGKDVGNVVYPVIENEDKKEKKEDEDSEEEEEEEIEDFLIEASKKPSNFNVGDALIPDFWFNVNHNIVWEIQAADLSRSSVHKGGIGVPKLMNDTTNGNGGTDRGIGLRFPRFIRERDDKKIKEATNAYQLVDMYYNQAGIKSATKLDDSEDDYLI